MDALSSINGIWSPSSLGKVAFQLPAGSRIVALRSKEKKISLRKIQALEASEGLSEELNMIAQMNMDEVHARRRVRSAFADFQRNLDHCLFKNVAGVRTEEKLGINSRGLEIFTKRWLPQSIPIKGVVFFCHGYGDTCTYFFDGIAKNIAAAGYGVLSMDYPGFGLSEGLHGYIPSFRNLVQDVIEEFSKVKP